MTSKFLRMSLLVVGTIPAWADYNIGACIIRVPTPPATSCPGYDLTGAELWNVNLTGANLINANLSLAELSSANLTNVNLSGADLSYASLGNANLTNANLANANVSHVYWASGVIWNNTTCPDGSNSNHHLNGSCLMEMDQDRDGIINSVDLDDDNDGVPDYIDAAPLDPGNSNELKLPLNNNYRGSSVWESVLSQ